MAEFYSNRKLRYEIHTLTQGRWIIASVIEDGRESLSRAFDKTDFEALEQRVMRTANGHLAAPSVSRVKVLREVERPDGYTTQTEIFNKEASGPAPEAAVTITEYPGPVAICQAGNDLFERDACRVLGVVMRKYLDKLVITPQELLAFPPYQKKLEEAHAALLSSTLHHIAGRQAELAKVDRKTRLGQLDILVRETTARARQGMGERFLPGLTSAPVGAIMEKLLERFQEADARFHLYRLFAQHFQGNSSYVGRLEYVLGQIVEGAPPSVIPMFDGIAAAVFDSALTIKDVLGHQPNMPSALIALGTLAGGKPIAGPGIDADLIKMLAALLATPLLKQTADALWQRVIREIGSTRPLMPRDSSAEWGAVSKLSGELLPITPEIHRQTVLTAIGQRRQRLQQNLGGA